MPMPAPMPMPMRPVRLAGRLTGMGQPTIPVPTNDEGHTEQPAWPSRAGRYPGGQLSLPRASAMRAMPFSIVASSVA